MQTPADILEVEAAHIIPRGGGQNGSNDPRNGLALCRSHHWAFDRLLWTLSNDYWVAIPKRVKAVSANEGLARVSGQTLELPKNSMLIPALEAAEHHRNRTTAMWGDFY